MKRSFYESNGSNKRVKRDKQEILKNVDINSNLDFNPPSDIPVPEKIDTTLNNNGIPRQSLRLSGEKIEYFEFTDPPKIGSPISGGGGKGDILTMRTQEPKKDEKTFAYILGVSSDKEDKIQQSFQDNVTSNRPVGTFGSPSPTKGRPKWVETPNGTRLNRIKDHGVILIYSNKAPDTNGYKKMDVDEAPLATKTNSIHITEGFLKEIQRERKACNDKRPVSQTKLMNGSAADAAKGLKKSHDKWEWLHLIAWSTLGKEAQDSKNLVGGLNHPNTDMMFIEREIPELVKFYKESGIDLEVTAAMEPGKQIARTIYYHIKTDDMDLCFEFDAQNRTKPSRSNGDYFHAIIETMLEVSVEKVKVNALKCAMPNTTPHQQKIWQDQQQGQGKIAARCLF